VVEQRDITVLIVSSDAGRRERAAAALSGVGEVLQAVDMSSAVDEMSIGRPAAVLIDSTLPQDTVGSLIAAIGDPDRALLWVPELQLELLDYGVFVQIPHSASDRVLAAAVQRSVEAQRSKAEVGRAREQERRLEHVVAVVRNVHHEINSPLTAIMAETQLMLMDADQLPAEQRRSLEAIEAMGQRIRELLRQLDGLGKGQR